MRRSVVVLLATLLLAGCATYTLVQPTTVAVANKSMKVRPTTAWNKVPKGAFDVPREENWTQNGPVLDLITFIGGLPEGEAIAKQRAKDDQKVPVFRSGMTPPDLVSMVESYYRIKAGATVFETTGVSPTNFLGQQAVEFNFSYVRADEVKRRGRALLAVANGKLYFMALDAAAVHYFDASLAEFQAIAASASIS